MNWKIACVSVGIIAVIAGAILTQGVPDKKQSDSLQIQKPYVIEEIVSGNVISIKPVQNVQDNDNFNQSMKKIEAGIKEVGARYKINHGETIFQFTKVYGMILYVEPKPDGNCTINIANAQKIIVNETDKPD